MEGKARTRPDILREVFGPYVQYCPCATSEQKLGQKPKSELKEIELSYCHHSICLQKTTINLKKRQNWIKNDPFNVLAKSGIWPILCQLIAILAKCFKI